MLPAVVSLTYIYFLLQFKQNYPEIYFQKFPPHPPPEGERSDEDREKRGGRGERRFQRISNYLQL